MRNDILEKKEDILNWIKENKSKSHICMELKCKQETLNSWLKKMEIEYMAGFCHYRSLAGFPRCRAHRKCQDRRWR